MLHDSTKPKTFLRPLLCAAAFAGFMALGGCDDSPDSPSEAVERAGDAAEDALDNAGDAFDDAARRID